LAERGGLEGVLEDFSAFLLLKARKWGVLTRIEARVKRESAVAKSFLGRVIGFPVVALGARYADSARSRR
jgi:hypothetical protein